MVFRKVLLKDIIDHIFFVYKYQVIKYSFLALYSVIYMLMLQTLLVETEKQETLLKAHAVFISTYS